MPFWDSVKLEMIKTGLAWLTLGLGWLLGQRIIAYWDMRKKRQELDIGTAMQFHKLYGEFKEVSRLWRIYRYEGPRPAGLKFPETTLLDLMKRAAAAEGGVEAIILKLATERVLSEEDIKTLGLFRQAYQKLREAIRDDAPLEWTYERPEYHLYNDLASQTAYIIASNKTKRFPTSAEAPSILRKITAIRSEDWDKEVKSLSPQTTDKGVS